MNKICICINFYIEIEICDFRSSSFSFDFLIIQKIKPSPIPYQPFNCWFVHLREPEFRSFNWKQKRTDIKWQSSLSVRIPFGKSTASVFPSFGFSCLNFSPFCFLSFLSFFFLFLYVCLVYSMKRFSRKLQETKMFDF